MGLAQGLYEGRVIGEPRHRSVSSPTCAPIRRASPTRRWSPCASSSASSTAPGRCPRNRNFYASKKGAQDAHEAIRPTYLDLPPETVASFLEADELQALSPDLGPLRRQPDAARGIRRDAGGHRAWTLPVARRRQGAAQPRLPGRLPGGGRQARGRRGRRDRAAAAARRGRRRPSWSSSRRSRSSPSRRRSSQRGDAGQGARGERHRPALDVRRDPLDPDRPRLRGEARRADSVRPQLGKLVNRLLQQGFNDILNEGYTAELEEELDRIEEGELPWKQAVVDFDKKFDQGSRDRRRRELPNVKADGVPLDEKCPKCGSPLVDPLRPLRRLRRLQHLPQERPATTPAI